MALTVEIVGPNMAQQNMGACLLFSYLYRRQPVDAVLGSILFYDQQQRFGVDEEQYLQNLILIRQVLIRN